MAKNGTVALVTKLPTCNFGPCPIPAQYDFKTEFGPWAFGCLSHYVENRHYPDLGVGKGQELKLREGVK